MFCMLELVVETINTHVETGSTPLLGSSVPIVEQHTHGLLSDNNDKQYLNIGAAAGMSVVVTKCKNDGKKHRETHHLCLTYRFFQNMSVVYSFRDVIGAPKSALRAFFSGNGEVFFLELYVKH